MADAECSENPAEELRDLRRRYAAALPAAARVSAHVRGARAALAEDVAHGHDNPEAAEQIRLWGDVADAFDAEHRAAAPPACRCDGVDEDDGDPKAVFCPIHDVDGAVSPLALSGAQDGGGPP